MNNKVLVVAPHPDDEVLGCAGTIKKLASRGDRIIVLIMTRGRKGLYSEERIRNVRQEAINAHKVLGASGTKFFDFSAPDLDIVSQSDLSSSIAVIIKEFEIDTMYIPHRGDIHHDHKAVFSACLVAARPVGEYTVRNIYCYETLSETEWSAPFSDDAFIPDRFVNITNEISSKLEAMKSYKSQLREFPNPRSLKTIEALATYRGSIVGFSFAEAFMTIRVIEY